MKALVLFFFSLIFVGNLAARFLVIDPERQFVNPYSYGGNNSINGIDPNGEEWFEIGEKWVYNEGVSEMDVIQFKGFGRLMQPLFHVERLVGEKELIRFDGAALSWLREDGVAIEWPAVSGNLDSLGRTQPDEQWTWNVGPVPEGWYQIDPLDIRAFDDLDIYQKEKSRWGRGYWPGGRKSWGDFRVSITPQRVEGPNGVIRTNFFIHGGAEPGSRGCIDLCGHNNRFFSLFKLAKHPLKLQIRYPSNPSVPAW